MSKWTLEIDTRDRPVSAKVHGSPACFPLRLSCCIPSVYSSAVRRADIPICSWAEVRLLRRSKLIFQIQREHVGFFLLHGARSLPLASVATEGLKVGSGPSSTPGRGRAISGASGTTHSVLEWCSLNEKYRNGIYGPALISGSGRLFTYLGGWLELQ